MLNLNNYENFSAQDALLAGEATVVSKPDTKREAKAKAEAQRCRENALRLIAQGGFHYANPG